ncbi:MAG: hydroxymethylglutaryl-CoA lyase [Phycisphaerales bacterium]|nr:hydroxymethylglutaryl-CoA lyase [Phycisphaerales bacterium]
MSRRVRITDVSPRDGLQNEPGVIPASEKARLVELLCLAGVDEVEVTSFVSPRWVPQLGDGAEVFAALAARFPPGTRRPMFSALVPNDRGLDGALAVNRAAGRALIEKVSLFTAASETFSRRNTNASIAETFDRFVPVLDRAAVAGLRVRLYVSCVVACPFEGPIAPDTVATVARQGLQAMQRAHDSRPAGAPGLAGIEIDLGDTIGAATPETIAPAIERTLALPEWGHARGPEAALVLHLHDTFGKAASCVTRALSLGVRSFDSAAGGLGGCPYASTPGKRAPGNIATTALVRAIREAGFEAAVDDEALARASEFAAGLAASRPPGSASP